MVWWSSVAISSFPSLLLFYYAFSKLRLYGFTWVCFQSETPGSNRLPHCSLLGSVWFALLSWHLAFSQLGLHACASVRECVSVLGERVTVVRQLTSEAVKWWWGRPKVWCVYSCIQTFFSPGRWRGSPHTSGCSAVKSRGCVCVYFQSIAAPSHLRLLRANWLGSGLRRLVALMKVSFPQLLWSFSPQNDLLNTHRQRNE